MNDQPSLTELRALATIARYRSFRKAADELGMASSTISHMMSGLEARLRTRLFNRTTRSVLPTPAGERLVSRLIPILEELDRAFAEVDAERDRPSGLLRLTASETVSMLLLEEVVPTFLALCPDVSLDLVAQPAMVDIVAEGFDAGVRLGEAVPRDMIAAKLGGPSRMMVVASPAYLQGKDLPRTPDDLQHHHCIRSRTPNGRPYKWEFEHKGEEFIIDAPGNLMLNRTELMVAAAVKGLGIAFVPERLAVPYVNEGALVPMLEDWCPSYPGLFIYYPGRHHVSARLRAFIDVMKNVPIL